MITEHGKQIKEAVEQVLAKDKWKYQYNEEFQFFHFGLGLNGPFKLIDYVLAIVHGVCENIHWPGHTRSGNDVQHDGVFVPGKLQHAARELSNGRQRRGTDL